MPSALALAVLQSRWIVSGIVRDFRAVQKAASKAIEQSVRSCSTSLGRWWQIRRIKCSIHSAIPLKAVSLASELGMKEHFWPGCLFQAASSKIPFPPHNLTLTMCNFHIIREQC